MTTAINDIDRLLQGAPVRVIHLGQAQVIVTAAPPLFHLLADGMPEYPEIELEATVIGLTGEVVWTCSGGTLSEVSGATAKLRYADLVAGAATVVASVTYAGEKIIGRASISVVRDGSASAGAKLLELNPSEQVFKINGAGEHAPDVISLTAVGQNLTGTPKFTFASGSGTLAAGTTSSQKILSFDNMVTDTVTIQVEQDGQVDRVTISKLRDGGAGADGVDGITALLTNETVALPASNAGAVSSLTTAVCTMKVYQGATDDTDNWSFSFSPASSAANVAYTINRSTVTVTGMAAGVDAAFIDIKASKSGAASITKRFSLTKSKAGAKGDVGEGSQGQRGTVNIPLTVAGVTWSDSAAAAGLKSGGFGTPIRFDLVTLVNTASGYIETKVWDGDSWEDPGLILNGNLTAPGTILTRALAADAVTAEKIRADAIQARHIAAGAITASSLAVGGDQNNLIPDPRFKDLEWWNLAGQEVSPADWTDAQLATDWKQNASLYMWPNGYVAEDAWTGLMPIVPGATYLIEYRVGFSSDWYGELTIDWHWPLVTFYQNGVPSSGYTWSDGGPIQYASNARGVRTISHVVTIPNDPRLVNSQLRIRRRIQSGSAEIGGFSITRVMDSVLIKDGAITAQKISVTELAAIVAFLGKLQIGPDGHIRQGMTDYKVGKGIWMGMHGGVPKLVVGDPSSGMLEWDGNQLIIQKAKEVSPFRGTLPSIDRRSQANTSSLVTYANLTPTLIDGTGPYTYRWSMNAELGPSGEVVMSGDPRGGSITIKGRGSNLVNVVWVSLEVVDANGAVARLGCQIYWQHGSGQIQ
ncbi:hypothetical protein [Massilia sp.]|uniref:hypothetical protein n=1 Tax=Massilia sp. TaxID=1882437 RepID=UPI0028AC8F97|nr:hypothetical protein [Massilia sp.]